MSTQILIQPPQQNKAGLCPHGLVPSACPICSNKGGVGGISKMQNTAPQNNVKSSQWSWMKCYAMGVALEAKEKQIANQKTAFERQIDFAKQLNKNIQNIADKIQTALNNIKDSAPGPVANVVQFAIKVIINPVLNVISQIPKIIEKLVVAEKFVQNTVNQVAEKLAAIFGDLKNFIDRKFIEDIKQKAKKLFSFFVFNIEDENYKNDDTLAVFKSRELKKFLDKIVKPIKKQDKDAN